MMNIPYVMKRCGTCKKWLVASNFNFHKQKNGKWGLKSQCKKCNKQWREENKEYKKEYDKKYNKENKEYRKKYNKQYYEDNKEYMKQYIKQWREENKEHMKEYRKQWYEDNKEHRKEYNKQWREENPEKCFNNQNKRRSKEENQGRGITKEQWKEMMEFFNWRCAYSGEKMQNNKSTYGRTIDHIVALDNGGLNEVWNCVPMLSNYNSSKNKRVDVINWYLEQEYFSEDRLNKIVEWQIYSFNKWSTENDELILINSL